MRTLTTSPALPLTDLYDAAGFTLAELTALVENRPPALKARRLPAEQVSVLPDGQLCLGHRALHLSHAAWTTLAGYVGLPAAALLSLDGDERAYVVTRRVSRGLTDRMPACLRLMVDEKRESIVGIADARLAQVGLGELLRVVRETLPQGLGPHDLRVGSFREGDELLCLQLYAPSISFEPRAGDIIYGGVALGYSMCGHHATQVFGYTRRKTCRSESVCHVCSDGDTKRTRRRPGHVGQVALVLDQVRRLLSLAWTQTTQKLEALQDLLHEKGDPHALLDAFVQANARKLSLNTKVIKALHEAIDAEATTGTAYDVWRAIAHVATHTKPGDLSSRMRMRLMRAGGELALHAVHQCPSCGSWLKDPRGKIPKETGAAQ